MAEPEKFISIEELIQKKFPGAEYLQIPCSSVSAYIIVSDLETKTGGFAYDCPHCGTVWGMPNQETSYPTYESKSSEEKEPRKKLHELSAEEFWDVVAEMGKKELAERQDGGQLIKIEHSCILCKKVIGTEYKREHCL